MEVVEDKENQPTSKNSIAIEIQPGNEVDDDFALRKEKRRLQREEEMNRKGLDMVQRAQVLETEGKTAVALALFKESLHYFPQGNPQLSQYVGSLQAKLLQEFDHPPKSGGHDPLEALFSAVSKTSSLPCKKQLPLPEQPPPRMEQRVSGDSNSGSVQDDSAEEEDISNATLLKRVKKVSVPVFHFVDKFLQVEALFQVSTKLDEWRRDETTGKVGKKRVHFHALDCALQPPPMKVDSDDELDQHLFQVEHLMDILSQCVRLADAAKKALGGVDFNAFPPDVFQHHKYGQYVHCTVLLSLGYSSCACKGARCCRVNALGVRDRLALICSTALRFILRRVFNHAQFQHSLLNSNNSQSDDVAAVVHRALLLFDTQQSLVDKFVLLGKGRDEDIAEFVEAYTFLSSLFPDVLHVRELVDANQVSFAKLRKCLAVAREFKLHDELVLSPLSYLEEFVSQLKEKSAVVHACRTHVDACNRQAMKHEDTCTCEGARKRRANALGIWKAPLLVPKVQTLGFLLLEHLACALCTNGLGPSDSIACDCCEKKFHRRCVNLPQGFDSEFVCGKCVVPKKVAS